MMMIVKNDDKKKASNKNTLAFNNTFFLSLFLWLRSFSFLHYFPFGLTSSSI